MNTLDGYIEGRHEVSLLLPAIACLMAVSYYIYDQMSTLPGLKAISVTL